MKDETGARIAVTKPKRENFKTDDDFGEAYAYWMRSKGNIPVAQTPSPIAPIYSTPVSKPVQVANTPGPGKRMPVRIEAERDFWNKSTKLRFQRGRS